MEAGRTIAGGFVTPDRTLMIASTSRVPIWWSREWRWATGATTAHGSSRRSRSIAQSRLLLDMEALAKQSGAMVNAVMLGLIAGCGRLPIPTPAFEGAIRADGKAVDANLKGFRSGLEAAHATNATVARRRRRQARSGHDVLACRSRTRHRRGHAAARPRRHSRRRPTARRLSGRRLCAALSRPAGAGPRRRRTRAGRRAAAARGRAASRGAHVLRGRDPRRPGQDRSGTPARASPPTWASNRASRSR